MYPGNSSRLQVQLITSMKSFLRQFTAVSLCTRSPRIITIFVLNYKCISWKLMNSTFHDYILYYFTMTTITKYHTLGNEIAEIYFLMVLEA
jgi:hypothetical protein